MPLLARVLAKVAPARAGPGDESGFAAAVVVVDALVCEGAGDALVESLQWDANDAQFLLRALLFRAITDLPHRPHEEPGIVTRPYQPALELALRLAET